MIRTNQATYYLYFLLLGAAPIFASTQNPRAPDSKPVDRVGWVSDQNTRSTSGIMWSCFSVFLICSWRCMHLNVPSVQESEAEWHTLLGGWLPYWPSSLLVTLWMRKIKWTLVMAIAPELGVAMSLRQHLEARNVCKKFEGMGFSMAHAFLANMGGFVMAVPREGGTLEYFPLRAPRNFDQLRQLDLFPATSKSQTQGRCLPVITTEDILDRSKSDAISKVLALIQCGWLITQSIARTWEGLPLTELELITLAFIFAAVVMYGFWWEKPFDVQRPVMLICPQEKAMDFRASVSQRTRDGDRQKNMTMREFEQYFGDYKLISGKFSRDTLGSLVFYATTIVFSGLHIVAWDWNFPSLTIQILWRLFSVAATASAVFPLLVLAIYYITGRDDSGTLGGILLIVALGVYFVARFGMFALVFYCFSSMPAAVYEAVDWAVVFPHFS